MGQLDNALRQQSIPFLGQVVGYNRNQLSDQDITQASGLGDLYNLSNYNDGYTITPPLKNNLVRILRPQFLAITGAYFTFGLTTANTEPSPKFYITVGTGYVDSTSMVAATPTDAQIIANHTKLKGDSNPYQTPSGGAGSIIVPNLNILALLPQDGDVNFRYDHFVIGIHFLQTPQNGTGYKLNKFLVNMTGIPIHG